MKNSVHTKSNPTFYAFIISWKKFNSRLSTKAIELTKKKKETQNSKSAFYKLSLIRVYSHPAPNSNCWSERRHWAGAVHYSSESPDLSPRSWNITWFRALTLSLLPFSRRPIEPVFLPPSSWCLHHTPDGSACLKNVYPFSVNVTDSLPSVHILYHQYGGGMVAQWLALSFHSDKVQFLFLCGQFNVRQVSSHH